VTETYVRSALAIIALIYWPFATVQPERRETRHSVYRTSIVQQITLELLAAITRYEKKHQRALFLPLQRIDNSIICSVYVNSTFAAVV